MPFRIEIHTLVMHGDYWIDFETSEERNAVIAFLNSVASSDGRQAERQVPFYVIENQEQQDRFNDFLRELARAHPSVAAPSDGLTPPPPIR